MVPEKSRIGLVGNNGTGKTTLLRLITGEMLVDSGSIVLPKNKKVGYMEQEFKEVSSENIIVYLKQKCGIIQLETSIRDLDAPGLRLHPIKGGRKGQWALDVDRNWRITFTFDGRDCDEMNYEDYH